MTQLGCLVVTLLARVGRCAAANEPIDPRVRLAISQWPDDAPRGAVSTFCAEHGISRKTFYAIRARARTDGPAAVLEPRVAAPEDEPAEFTDEVKDQARRGAGRAGGLRAGPRADQRARQDAARWGWTRCPRRRRWRGSSARPASRVLSRRRSRARRGAGSSIRPRTRAGSWTRPSTCSPADASA